MKKTLYFLGAVAGLNAFVIPLATVTQDPVPAWAVALVLNGALAFVTFGVLLMAEVHL